MKIYVVGIGPGGTEQMTAAACKAIEKSEVIVGYSKYIELIESLIKGKEVYTSVMKQEKQRCKKALEYWMREFMEWLDLCMKFLKITRK